MVKNNNLARLRERRGMTQKEVAEELDVSRPAVSQWERGTAFPSMEKQLALSRLYGVTLEELYFGRVPEGTVTLPEGEAEEPEPATEETVPKRCFPHKRIILAILLAVFYLSIYIWGVLTNSRSVATANLFYMTAILFVAVLLYGIYRAITYFKVRKEQK